MKKMLPILIWIMLFFQACAAPGEPATPTADSATPTADSATATAVNTPTEVASPAPEPSPTAEANVQIKTDFEKYGFALDPDKYQISTEGVVTEIGTGEVVYADGKFEIHFVVNEVRNSGNLVTTSYEPKKGNVPENSNWATDEVGSEYLIPIIAIWRSEYKQIYGIDPYIKGALP